jgi:hypothetical protein
MEFENFGGLMDRVERKIGAIQNTLRPWRFEGRDSWWKR